MNNSDWKLMQISKQLDENYKLLEETINNLTENNCYTSSTLDLLQEITDKLESTKKRINHFHKYITQNKHFIVDSNITSLAKTGLIRFFSQAYKINNPTFEDLALITYSQFKRIRYVGKKGTAEVLNVMKLYNIHFKED